MKSIEYTAYKSANYGNTTALVERRVIEGLSDSAARAWESAFTAMVIECYKSYAGPGSGNIAYLSQIVRVSGSPLKQPGSETYKIPCPTAAARDKVLARFHTFVSK